MKRRAQTTLVILLLGGTLACNLHNPAEPSEVENRHFVLPPPPPPPPAGQLVYRTAKVVSGWDGSAVANATVHVGDQVVLTDASGEFTAGFSDDNQAIDIDAAGYLSRRTRATRIVDGPISLWPAANEAERQAIDEMAFYNAALYKSTPEPGNETRYFLTILDATSSPSDPTFAAWLTQFAQISQLTNLHADTSLNARGEYCELVVDRDATRESCGDPWGFCGYHFSDYRYFTKPIHVVREMSDRPDVILRALVSTLIYHPNPLPGLMNKTAPASELSLLERQTLKMLAIRPVGTSWPDTDPGRQ